MQMVVVVVVVPRTYLVFSAKKYVAEGGSHVFILEPARGRETHDSASFHLI
jgi:hypothetical protein